jgi:ABC-type antimicrobial peptide transport system permease subunit
VLGLALGVGATFAWERGFAEPDLTAPAGLLLASFALTVVVAAACLPAAVRIVGVDPIIALREE